MHEGVAKSFKLPSALAARLSRHRCGLPSGPKTVGIHLIGTFRYYLEAAHHLRSCTFRRADYARDPSQIKISNDGDS